MALEEELQLDLGPALESIRGELARAIEDVPSTFRSAFADELQGVVGDVGAAAELAREELDRVFAQPVETSVDVDTSEVDAAAEQIADASQPIEAPVVSDTGELDVAESRIDDLTGTRIDVPVEVDSSEIEAATTELEQLGDAASSAAGAVESISTAAGGAGATGTSGISATTTAVGGLRGAIEGLTGAELAQAGVGVGFLTSVGLIAREAATAEAQTRSFNVRVGDLADVLNRVDVHGLNEDLSTLALRLGADDDRLRLTLARIVQLSDGSTRSRKEVGALGQEFVALAAYLSSVNPSLGTIDEVLSSLPQALARGGRALAPFGLTLSALDVQTRAFAETGKSAAADLTLFDRAAAGLGITMDRLGPQIAGGINAAAENSEVRLRALRQEVLETVESVGQPLVGPVVAALEGITPALTGGATAIARIGAAATTVLVPALTAIGKAAELASEGVEQIPAPVLAAGSAMVIGVKGAEALGSAYAGIVGKITDLRRSAAALDLGSSLTSSARAGAAALATVTAAQEASTVATAKAVIATQVAATAEAELVAAKAAGIGVEAAQIAAIEANTVARVANAAAAEAQAAATAASGAASAASLGPVVLAGAAIAAATAALVISARQHADYQKLADSLVTSLQAEAAAFTDVEHAALATGDAIESKGLRKGLTEAFGEDRVKDLTRAGITLGTVNAQINDFATRSDVNLKLLRRAWVDLGRDAPKNAEEVARATDELIGRGRSPEDAARLASELGELGQQLDITRGKFFDQVEARKLLINDALEAGLKSDSEAERLAAAETLKLSGAYKELAPEVQAAVDVVIQAGTAEERLAVVTAAAAKSAEDQAAAAEAIATGFTNALSALDKYIGTSFDATKQDLDFTVSLDKMREKQADLIKTKGAAAAAYVIETAAGRENISALLDQVKAQANLIGKNIQAGETVATATARYKAQVTAIGEVAKAAGLTTKQYEDLLKQFGLTPEEINTKLTLTGVPEATAAADGLKTHIERLDPKIRATLTIDQVKALEALDEVDRRIKALGPNADVGVAADITNFILPNAEGNVLTAVAPGRTEIAAVEPVDVSRRVSWFADGGIETPGDVERAVRYADGGLDDPGDVVRRVFYEDGGVEDPGDVERQLSYVGAAPTDPGDIERRVSWFADGGVDAPSVDPVRVRWAADPMPRPPDPPVRHFAAGGEDHTAQIATTLRVFAEPETGGEAYIPLAPTKRKRSEEILSTVADRFGYELAPVGATHFAGGGIVGGTGGGWDDDRMVAVLYEVVDAVRSLPARIPRQGDTFNLDLPVAEQDELRALSDRLRQMRGRF